MKLLSPRCIPESHYPVRAAETKRPKIKGPFWVVLVFGRAKWTSIKGKIGLPARKFGLKAVQTRKTSAIF